MSTEATIQDHQLTSEEIQSMVTSAVCHVNDKMSLCVFKFRNGTVATVIEPAPAANNFPSSNVSIQL